MYENGKRVNGYNKKNLHKNYMKKQYVSRYYYCSGSNQTWEDYLAHLREDERDRAIKYWKVCYLSGPRQYARRETNRKIRREGKVSVYSTNEHDIYEDVSATNYGGYRRAFDYAWTVW